MTVAGHDNEARIRVYDVMAHGSSGAGLNVATGRHLDLPVSELARLLEMLGADGLQAFCLYLEHLEQVPGVDGELTLGVPHFSARWLLTASMEAAERSGTGPLSKNAATRGHQAVERSGLLHGLANPPAAAGQGARGRTWRAVLNPRLVVIHGGRDDLDELPQVRRGRPPKGDAVPLSRKSGKRASGAGIPQTGEPVIRDSFPLSQGSGNGESENGSLASGLVRAALPVPGEADTTSAVGVVDELLSSTGKPGVLAGVFVPALRADRSTVLSRLRPLLNDVQVGERAADTVAALALPAEETRRPDVLVELIASTLLGERDTPADLAQMGVSGRPVLSVVELQERLVVGLLIGWGLRRVVSWGAWLYQATRPDWEPKPGPLLDRFIQVVRGLQSLLNAAPNLAAPAAEPVTARVLAPAVGESTELPGDGVELLPEEMIGRYFADARRKWPMFCRDGSAQAADPAWRSRLVRMYLAAEDRQSELESTEQAVSR